MFYIAKTGRHFYSKKQNVNLTKTLLKNNTHIRNILLLISKTKISKYNNKKINKKIKKINKKINKKNK